MTWNPTSNILTHKSCLDAHEQPNQASKQTITITTYQIISITQEGRKGKGMEDYLERRWKKGKEEGAPSLKMA